MISVERRREINRKSYYKNRDKVLKYQRKYHKKNKKKRKITRHNYYEKNKEKISIKSKEYNKKPEVKKHKAEWNKEYMRDESHRNKRREMERTKKHREKINARRRERKLKDKNFVIQQRLRRLLQRALTEYGEGKMWKASKYGIDYQAIIEHLKPFPEDISKYHIDHRIPLCKFDLTKLEEVKKAFAPENHQWLLKEENLKKGGRYINLERKEIQ